MNVSIVSWSFVLFKKENKIILISTNGITNLLIGDNPLASGTYDEDGLKLVSRLNIGNDKYLEYVINYLINNPIDNPFLNF